MKIRKRIFFLIGGIVCFNYAFAGSNPTALTSWAATADVKKMIVDNDNLWIAGGGLIQYHIPTGKSQRYLVQQGLTSNAVIDVAINEENQEVWAATTSGLSCLKLGNQENRGTGHWQSFGKPEGLDDLFILSLCFYRKGPFEKNLLFIGTRNAGLYMLRTDDGKDTRILPALGKNMLPNPRISCLTTDPIHGLLWIGTPAGVFCCTPGNGLLKIDISNIYRDLPARRLVANECSGDTFCLTDYSEIFQYRFSEKKWVKVPRIPYPDDDLKIKDLVLANTNDNTEEIIYAATTEGIFGHCLKEKKWQKLPGYNGKTRCITVGAINGSSPGKNHVLYFADSKGIYSLYSLQPLQSCLQALQSWEQNKHAGPLILNEPPFNNTINTIFIDDRTDTVWLGIDGGIAQFDKKNRHWQFFGLFSGLSPFSPPFSPFPGPGCEDERILALYIDNTHLWFGTLHHGIGIINRNNINSTGSMGKIRFLPGTPENATVTSIIGDSNKKKVWFALLGTRGGVYEYDMKTQKTRVLPFLDSVSVTYLLEEGDWIWAATAQGVAKFNKSQGFPHNVRNAFNPFQPQLNFNEVLTLALDSVHNQLWITTEYKVITYDRTLQRLNIFKDSTGFPWSPITSSLYTRQKVWLGTEGFGLYMVDPQSEAPNNLTRVKGVADNYIISLAYDKKEENLWVGTAYGGLSIIHFKE